MAPELKKGQEPKENASDIFSTALSFLKILTNLEL